MPKEKKPVGKKDIYQPLDEKLEQIIDKKKNENSALEKIYNALKKDNPKNFTHKK